MHYTALVTVLVALLYVWLGTRVAQAHRQYGVKLPKMSGSEEFERINRAHMNTVEWAPIFLPLLWLFAFYVSDMFAAVVGLVWIGARIWYLAGYRAGAEKRFMPFLVQALACGVLLAGDVIGIVLRLAKG
jgi:glutathione S-transferase